MAKSNNPFRHFDSSPEAIRLVVMMYVRYPLSLRNVEDLLFERAIDICHETVRLWWNRFGAGSQFDPVTASGSNLTAVLSCCVRASPGSLDRTSSHGKASPQRSNLAAVTPRAVIDRFESGWDSLRA